MEAVLEKQRQALALTIKEANKKETQRIKRLSTVRNVIEQQSLLSRYDKERAFDREYIERLSTDFFTLQQRAQNNDEMMKFVEKRKEIQHSQPVKSHGPAELLPNRFAGLEDYDGILFHTDIVKKFDRHDQRFESKTNRAPYNPATEVKKVSFIHLFYAYPISDDVNYDVCYVH